MKNLLLSLSLGLLCSSFTIIPAEPAIRSNAPDVAASADDNIISDADIIYHTVQLEQFGLSKEAFDYAWKGYQYLMLNNKISTCTYLTICDFSQSSRKKRMYIIDVENYELLMHTYVAHGKNSGAEYATRFSNRPKSLQSSLGFYITSGTYMGKYGLSLRINGMEPGINDNALRRAVVIHGSAFVNDKRVKAGKQIGRSWGCPAVSKAESKFIINTIKNGSCFFIYHPSQKYLLNSKILNG